LNRKYGENRVGASGGASKGAGGDSRKEGDDDEDQVGVVDSRLANRRNIYDYNASEYYRVKVEGDSPQDAWRRPRERGGEATLVKPWQKVLVDGGRGGGDGRGGRGGRGGKAGKVGEKNQNSEMENWKNWKNRKLETSIEARGPVVAPGEKSEEARVGDIAMSGTNGANREERPSTKRLPEVNVNRSAKSRIQIELDGSSSSFSTASSSAVGVVAVPAGAVDLNIDIRGTSGISYIGDPVSRASKDDSQPLALIQSSTTPKTTSQPPPTPGESPEEVEEGQGQRSTNNGNRDDDKDDGINNKKSPNNKLRRSRQCGNESQAKSAHLPKIRLAMESQG